MSTVVVDADDVRPGDVVLGRWRPNGHRFPEPLTVKYVSDNNLGGVRLGPRIHWDNPNYHEAVARGHWQYEIEERP